MVAAAGFVMKARINGVVYGIQDYDAQGDAPFLDISNSEGFGGTPLIPAGVPASAYETNTPGMRSFRVTLIQACFDSALNQFAAPLSIYPGNFYVLQIFPAGLLGPQLYSPSWQVGPVGMRGNVKALQPVTITGKATGWFQFPSS